MVPLLKVILLRLALLRFSVASRVAFKASSISKFLVALSSESYHSPFI